MTAAPPMSTPPAHSSRLTASLALMQLTDSALPTGAFSHSLGFESYMTREVVVDEASFARWLSVFVEQQLTFTDAAAIRLVYAAGEFTEVADLDELITVQALPRQIRASGITMGQRMLKIAVESYASPWLAQYAEGVDQGELSSHSATVFGVFARSVGVDVDEAVSAYLYSTVISLTQNAVRAIPLGQNAGQRIIRNAQRDVLAAVERSRGVTLDEVGATSPGLEIAQIHHERQRARLFMS